MRFSTTGPETHGIRAVALTGRSGSDVEPMSSACNGPASTEVELQSHVVAALVRASDTLREDFDAAETIGHLIEVCWQVVAGAEVSVILADTSGRLCVAGESSERKRVLEQYQIDNDAGPSIGAYRSGESSPHELVSAPDYPWPGFAALARVVGYVAVRTIPLRLRNETIGVLSIAQTTDVSRSAFQDSLLRALADGITIGFVNRRAYSASHRLSEQLQGALDTRVLIEQAKGVVAARLELSVDEAFEALRAYARSTHRKLTEVSAAILDGSLIPSELMGMRRVLLARSSRREASRSAAARPPRRDARPRALSGGT